MTNGTSPHGALPSAAEPLFIPALSVPDPMR